MTAVGRILGALALAALAGACNPEGDDTSDTSDTSDTGGDTSDTDTSDTDTSDTDTSDTDTGTTACTDDANEPDDVATEATALTAGTDASGQICADDSDWFSFTAPQGCLVEAHLDFDETRSDLDLYLYDAAEDIVDWSESGSTDESILYAHLDAPAVYYLEVIGYLGDEGAYTIGYGCATSDCTDDGNEPDDGLADATPLTEGTPIAGQSCLLDDDWYAIEVGVGCEVTVTLDFLHATGDLDLDLLDAAEETLDSSWSEADGEEVYYDNTGAARTVYAVVVPWEGAEAPYTISVAQDCPLPCTDDGGEDDDESGEANALATGAPVDGQVCAYDEDWYTFTGTAGCEGAVTLTLDGWVGDLDLALYDAALAPLDGSTGVDDLETVAYDLAGAGANATFYVAVRGYGEDQGAYAISRIEDCVACVADAETDDVHGGATALTAGNAPQAAEICTDDEDWYSLTVAAGCTADVLVEFEHARGDLDVELYDDPTDPAVSESDSADDDEGVGYANDTAAPVPLWVRVFGYEGADAPYAISFDEVCACTDDAAEPNDTFETAGPVTIGTPVVGQVCGDETAYDEDWYTFTAGAGCRVAATLDLFQEWGDLDLYLLDDAELLLEYSETGGDQERVVHEVGASAEVLYLWVTGYFDYSPGENGNGYTLSVEALCPE